MHDEIAVANQRLWEEEVRKGCGYTIPWLDLDVQTLRRYAGGELESVPERLTHFYPARLLENLAGKDVLCLAAGGGQQSAVFSLLGGQVTVLDLAEGQLRGDVAAATHYGYEITAVHGDMRDLSGLDASAFDLVFQADSISYVPSAREVYGQVARVLRPGGRYRVKHIQPALHFVHWDGEGYRIGRPYRDCEKHREDGGFEFRHHMDDIFDGLLDAGFSIERVCEAPYFRQPLPAEPGGWTHERTFLGGEFAVVARRN
jgi:SAM-dependent methyltransferase